MGSETSAGQGDTHVTGLTRSWTRSTEVPG